MRQKSKMRESKDKGKGREPMQSAVHSDRLLADNTADSIARLKRKMQKSTALADYYDDLGGRKISTEEELKDVRSKMMFTQKEMLKLCLESKKIVKDMEQKNMQKNAA